MFLKTLNTTDPLLSVGDSRTWHRTRKLLLHYCCQLLSVFFFFFCSTATFGTPCWHLLWVSCLFESIQDLHFDLQMAALASLVDFVGSSVNDMHHCVKGRFKWQFIACCLIYGPVGARVWAGQHQRSSSPQGGSLLMWPIWPLRLFFCFREIPRESVNPSQDCQKEMPSGGQWEGKWGG